MHDHGCETRRPCAWPSRGTRLVWMAACLLSALLARPVAAGETPTAGARAGIADASAAALSWAPDAELVYLENDEDLDGAGNATRWGYLFYSRGLGKTRGYSVRGGRILTAEDLVMAFEAPPVSGDWIDSDLALEAAEASAGRAYRRDQKGVLSTMLLTRGAFHDDAPNQTTWTIIYTSPSAASLFVVVDAVAGKVRRTWRG